MTLPRPSEGELSEYVDGRLSERRRAEIAAWLLEHPREAAELERLQELDEALRGVGGEILDEPVPERLREVLRRWPEAEEAPRPTKRALPDWGGAR